MNLEYGQCNCNNNKTITNRMVLSPTISDSTQATPPCKLWTVNEMKRANTCRSTIHLLFCAKRFRIDFAHMQDKYAATLRICAMHKYSVQLMNEASEMKREKNPRKKATTKKSIVNTVMNVNVSVRMNSVPVCEWVFSCVSWVYVWV